jgi:hypothetical protein
MEAFVLAKNEENNIERCLSGLHAAGYSTTLLDSGSTDRTRDLAETLGSRVETYPYVDHLSAYRYVCTERLPKGELGLFLDADMVMSQRLAREIEDFARQKEVEVVIAPIEMWWGGARLRRGSLCPPKAIAFRGGHEYFQASGHGERLRPHVNVAVAKAPLIHDDRKPYDAYLASQARYAKSLIERARSESLSFRDRLRLSTPSLVLGVPLYSYLVRGGFVDGRAGLLYALDRLISEAIMLREGVASRLKPHPKPPREVVVAPPARAGRTPRRRRTP